MVAKNWFEVSANERASARRLALESVARLSAHALRGVSDLSQVPYKEIMRFKRSGRVDERYVPLLNTYFNENGRN